MDIMKLLSRTDVARPTEKYPQNCGHQGEPERTSASSTSLISCPLIPATMPDFNSLPPISRPPIAAPGGSYPPDPRYASPNAVNSYLPPGQQGPPQQQLPHLPPLQPLIDPRSPAYPPPDQRGGHRDGRHLPGLGYGQEPYSSGPYDAYRGQPPQGPPIPNKFCGHGALLASGVYGYHPESPGVVSQLTLAAPRQRTSIACRHCRRRKIRCSDYETAPGGKCKNCARMNQECIFEPVSSKNSTAFIPVSAVPGGVPPGTQLFGAYGQPLNPSSGPASHPPGTNQRHPSYAPPVLEEVRADDASQVAGKRRKRTSEQDVGRRPPAQRVAVGEDAWRKAALEFSIHNSPGGIKVSQITRNPGGSTLPQPAPGGSYAVSALGGQSPTTQNGSGGASTVAQQSEGSNQQSQQGDSSVMRLRNVVEKQNQELGDKGQLGMD